MKRIKGSNEKLTKAGLLGKLFTKSYHNLKRHFQWVTSSGLAKNLKYYFLQSKRFINFLIKPDPEKIAVKTINIGLIILGSFAAIFIIWGVFAPINSASIAMGRVVLDFNKKTIQHLEGGIIEKILVKEGQQVAANQPLIYLRDIQASSENKMVRKQLITSLAVEERLKAQRDRKSPEFSFILKQYQSNQENNELGKIINTQKNLFQIKAEQIKAEALKGRINILKKRIDQFNEEISGIIAQKIAAKEELKVLYQQQKMTKKLVNNNNSPLNKLLEIKKQIAIAKGKKGELKASIAKAKQAISETELEIINLKNESLDEILSELQEVEVKISDLTQQLASTKDILKRTIIKSPVSGIVTDLKYHTIGAVISPAAEIMYIVPGDDELIIEARVNPQDIDNVKSGLNAKIQLTAFKAKKVPKLLGQVLSVSADIILDEISGEQYFLARIKINKKELKKLKIDITLYPGMPAQTFIIIGSRSLFDYLFSPITQAAYKAFREE